MTEKKYTLRFVGRRINAIGIFYEIIEEVAAASLDDALLKLYNTYDHISQVKVLEEKE